MIYQPKIKDKPKVKTSLEANVIFKGFIPKETIALQEQFLVMYLNNSSLVLGVYKLSVGGRSGTIADSRLILSIIILPIFKTKMCVS